MRRIRTNYVRTVLIFAVLFLLSACKAELWDASQGPQEVALCASTAQTRTEMLSNGLSATWKSDDKIAVWAMNSSGSFVFSNQTFGVYGSGDGHGYFTSTLQSSMADGKYTYLCCYPKPESVTGTKVTFTLPAEQDGKVSGGADIMIADPVKHGPLATVSEIEDGNGLSMKMNRMMHQFRFYIPEEVTALGDDHIRKIQLTFPKNVVGKVTYDLTDPSAAPVITEGSNVVTVTLDKGLVSTDENGRQYACVAIFPTQFEAGEDVQVKAFTPTKMASIDPISLQGRKFDAGHSTPVRLNIKGLEEFPYKITFTVAANNLGEDVNSVTFTAPNGCFWGNGKSEYIYAPGRKIKTGEQVVFRFENESDYKNFSGKTMSLTFDSDNAVTTASVVCPAISTNRMIDLSIAVPYLFFEDFSKVSSISSYDAYSSGFNSGEKSAVSFLSGWSGARVGAKAGTAVRIAARRETSADYPARIDSAPIYGIKDGCEVNIKIEYNYSSAYQGKNVGQTILQGYVTNLDPIKSPESIYVWQILSGYQDFSKIEGTFDENDYFDINDNTGSYDNITNSRSYQLNDITRGTRLTWASVNKHSAGTNNTTLWFYIDNIKVQIVK